MSISMGVGLFPTESPARMRELTHLAEELGYDNVWFGDSQNIWREAYVNMAAAAVGTERIVFGTGVTQAITRHPSVLASVWATLHELTGGRIACGHRHRRLLAAHHGPQPDEAGRARGTVGDLRSPVRRRRGPRRIDQRRTVPAQLHRRATRHPHLHRGLRPEDHRAHRPHRRRGHPARRHRRTLRHRRPRTPRTGRQGRRPHPRRPAHRALDPDRHPRGPRRRTRPRPRPRRPGHHPPAPRRAPRRQDGADHASSATPTTTTTTSTPRPATPTSSPTTSSPTSPSPAPPTSAPRPSPSSRRLPIDQIAIVPFTPDGGDRGDTMREFARITQAASAQV